MIKHKHIEVCVFFSKTIRGDLLNENILSRFEYYILYSTNHNMLITCLFFFLK